MIINLTVLPDYPVSKYDEPCKPSFILVQFVLK